MTQSSTITVARITPKIIKIKFANPPVNLIIPETVTRLHEVVKELSEDEKVQVVIFTSGIVDYFYNHFDLTRVAEFPIGSEANAIPVWTDLVLRLSKAPFISIASIRGRTRGAGTNYHWHLIYVTLAVRKHSSVNPKLAPGLFQAVEEVNAYHDSSDGIGHLRQF